MLVTKKSIHVLLTSCLMAYHLQFFLMLHHALYLYQFLSGIININSLLWMKNYTHSYSFSFFFFPSPQDNKLCSLSKFIFHKARCCHAKAIITLSCVPEVQLNTFSRSPFLSSFGSICQMNKTLSKGYSKKQLDKEALFILQWRITTSLGGKCFGFVYLFVWWQEHCKRKLMPNILKSCCLSYIIFSFISLFDCWFLNSSRL